MLKGPQVNQFLYSVENIFVDGKCEGEVNWQGEKSRFKFFVKRKQVKIPGENPVSILREMETKLHVQQEQTANVIHGRNVNIK